MRHHLKVLGIAAQAVIALVINLLLAWDVPEEVCVADDVNSYCLSIEGHAPVSAASSFTGCWSGPEMAGAWLAINDKPHVHDVTASMDAIDGFISSIRFSRHTPTPDSW